MMKLLLLLLFLSQSYAEFAIEEKDAIVEKVNCYRNYHQATDVVWDDNVASNAQEWANYLANNNKFTHSNSQFGENLFAMSSTSLPKEQTSVIDRAIDSWYSEEENYDYSHPGFDSTTGHFTQLVWLSTRKIGTGFAISNNGAMKRAIVVMQFDPPGNMNSASIFAQNVKPPVDEPTPSPTPEPTPTPSPTPEPTPTPSPTPEPNKDPMPFISIKVPFYRTDDTTIRNVLCPALTATLPFTTTSCKITYKSSTGAYYGVSFTDRNILRQVRTYLQQNNKSFTSSAKLYCDSTIAIGIEKNIYYRLLASTKTCQK